MIYRTFLVAAAPLGLACFSSSNRTPAFRSVSVGTKGPVRPRSASTPVGRMAVSTETTRSENGQSSVEPEGGEVLGIPSIGETLGGLAAPLTHGQTVTGEAVRLSGELARVAVGRSEIAAARGDRRFSDPAWSGN